MWQLSWHVVIIIVHDVYVVDIAYHDDFLFFILHKKMSYLISYSLEPLLIILEWTFYVLQKKILGIKFRFFDLLWALTSQQFLLAFSYPTFSNICTRFMPLLPQITIVPFLLLIKIFLLCFSALNIFSCLFKY